MSVMEDDIVLAVQLKATDVKSSVDVPSHLRLKQPVGFPVGFRVLYVVLKDGRKELRGEDLSRHPIS
jgi:hypothetical protein